MKVALRRLLFVSFFTFLLSPIVIVVLSSVTTTGLFNWPIDHFTLRWYEEFFSDSQWLDALLVSVIVALLAAVLSALCALTATIVMKERQFLGQRLLRGAMLLPLAFPHAATGVAFLGILNRVGMLGTYAGIVFAHIIITLPFAFRPIYASMKQLDPSMLEAARSLGANPMQIFTKVTLPLLKPGLITSLLFAFLISFDETTITLFLVGTRINTLPVKILSDIQENSSPVISAVSTLLIIAAVIFVCLLRLIQRKGELQGHGI